MLDCIAVWHVAIDERAHSPGLSGLAPLLLSSSTATGASLLVVLALSS